MDALEQTLEAVLSDPEKLRQVTALAESLGIKPPADAAEPEAANGGASAERSRVKEEGAPSRSADPAELLRLASKLGAAGGSEARVLSALRPTLSAQGRQRVDRALRAASLSHLAARLLGSRTAGTAAPAAGADGSAGLQNAGAAGAQGEPCPVEFREAAAFRQAGMGAGPEAGHV